MSLRRLATAALLLASACGGAPALPQEDLLLHVTLGADEVAPGQGFPVTVVRVWSKDLEPSAWDERALAPLVLRLEESVRREDERRVQETLRYRGYAFARKDVTVPPAKLTARPLSGGPERSTSSPRLRVRVKPEVDATKAGPPEPPGEPLAEPLPRWPWLAGGTAALLALFALLATRRRRALARRDAPPPPAPPGYGDLLERLSALAARTSGGTETLCADVVQAGDVLREFVARRWGLRTRERTSEEVLAALAPRMTHDPVERMGALLARADAVKFAAGVPTPAERATFLTDVERFVTTWGGA